VTDISNYNCKFSDAVHMKFEQIDEMTIKRKISDWFRYTKGRIKEKEAAL